MVNLWGGTIHPTKHYNQRPQFVSSRYRKERNCFEDPGNIHIPELNKYHDPFNDVEIYEDSLYKTSNSIILQQNMKLVIIHQSNGLQQRDLGTSNYDITIPPLRNSNNRFTDFWSDNKRVCLQNILQKERQRFVNILISGSWLDRCLQILDYSYRSIL